MVLEQKRIVWQFLEMLAYGYHASIVTAPLSIFHTIPVTSIHKTRKQMLVAALCLMKPPRCSQTEE